MLDSSEFIPLNIVNYYLKGRHGALEEFVENESVRTKTTESGQVLYSKRDLFLVMYGKTLEGVR